jgi:hypothetical protein
MQSYAWITISCTIIHYDSSSLNEIRVYYNKTTILSKMQCIVIIISEHVKH